MKSLSCVQLCDSMDCLHPWNFPGQSTGVGCHFLLQGIFLTWGSNPGLPHCGQMLYCLSHQGILITLTRQTFVSKVMSLLFHMLSSFVIAFLPSSKCLLISWPTVTIRSDFRAQEDKVCHCVHFFSIYALK